jgi:hypothetical protein
MGKGRYLNINNINNHLDPFPPLQVHHLSSPMGVYDDLQTHSRQFSIKRVVIRRDLQTVRRFTVNDI